MEHRAAAMAAKIMCARQPACIVSFSRQNIQVSCSTMQRRPAEDERADARKQQSRAIEGKRNVATSERSIGEIDRRGAGRHHDTAHHGIGGIDLSGLSIDGSAPPGIIELVCDQKAINGSGFHRQADVIAGPSDGNWSEAGISSSTQEILDKGRFGDVVKSVSFEQFGYSL